MCLFIKRSQLAPVSLLLVRLNRFSLLHSKLFTKDDVFISGLRIYSVDALRRRCGVPFFFHSVKTTKRPWTKALRPLFHLKAENYRRCFCKTLNECAYLAPLLPKGLPEVALNCTFRSFRHLIVYLLSSKVLWHADWAICVSQSLPGQTTAPLYHFSTDMTLHLKIHLLFLYL